ncbi:MAG: hypothetical protein KGJ86_04945 [Chloroflexota bacterium]|nr:hypothetical protein [Chloroflexota bacterium]
MALAIIVYDALWVYRSGSVAIRAAIAYRKLQRWQSVDWLGRAQEHPNFDRAYHLVIVPTYGESVDILRTTLTYLANQDFPRERLAVVVGFESRDREAWKRSQQLLEEFRGRFGYFWTNFHRLTAGEVPGKSSNEASAARYAKQRLVDEAGVDAEFTTVTTCDADSRLPRQYLSALTSHFLSFPRTSIFQPAILFYSNIWRVPTPSRVMNSLHSIYQLAKLTRTDKLIPQSTYSMSLAACIEVGYWDGNVIPEDSHMFFKMLFHFGSQVRVVPMYLAVIADAVESTSYVGTVRSQFNQEKRWAWGVADVPYVLRGWARAKTPGFSTGYRVLRYVEEHLNWPIGPFLLTFGGGAPAYFNHDFAYTPLGRVLPSLTGQIMTSSMAFMVLLWVVDWKLKPDAETAWPLLTRLIGLVEWLLLPVAGLMLSAVPGLVAHTRLLFGRYMEYNVTPKLAGPPASNVEAGRSAELEPLGQLEAAFSPVRTPTERR